MQVTESGDPRLQALFGTGDFASEVRPSVRLPRKQLSSAAVAIGAILAGLVLFGALNARRVSETVQPDNAPRSGVPAMQFLAPPPLYVPAPPPLEVPSATVPQEPAHSPAPVTAPAPRAVPPKVASTSQPIPQQFPRPIYPPIPGPAARNSAGSPLVIDSSSGGAVGGPSPMAAAPTGSMGQPSGRMRASALANRSMTIPQGSLIHAVLETGFDSTKPGFARAIVSRNVRGFDGKNVLVPRGSRLIGEYGSDVGQGHKRVAIIWTRLIRPDGMTIALNSPAVDTVGRGGVPASVNTHFFQRLGDALLQSTFEIGREFAGRAISDPVVIVSPGTATAAPGQVMPATTYVPTLTVPAGKSVSVFAAHDLDFSEAGAR